MATDSSVLSKMANIFYRKETLLWTPLLMDVMLASITYPMFYNYGIKSYFDVLKVDKKEIEKLEKDKNVASLWDLMMTAYSGYSLLLASSTYCCYYYPECRKPTGLAMFALMFVKKFAMKTQKKLQGEQELLESKDDTLLYFYFPFYGGYCLINLYQWYQSRNS